MGKQLLVFNKQSLVGPVCPLHIFYKFRFYRFWVNGCQTAKKNQLQTYSLVFSGAHSRMELNHVVILRIVLRLRSTTDSLFIAREK